MKTVSLELSRKLKEAGYPQGNSTWIWGKEVDPSNPGYCDEVSLILSEREYDFFPLYVSPTADEILEQLPDELDKYFLYIYKRKDKWWVIYSNWGISGSQYEKSADTLADAAAKCWLYLKENNLLEVKG